MITEKEQTCSPRIKKDGKTALKLSLFLAGVCLLCHYCVDFTCMQTPYPRCKEMLLTGDIHQSQVIGVQREVCQTEVKLNHYRVTFSSADGADVSAAAVEVS